MWVGLIQSSDGLSRRKRLTLPSERESFLPGCLRVGTLAFSCLQTHTEISAPPRSLAGRLSALLGLQLTNTPQNSTPVSLHNRTGQFVIISQSISLPLPHPPPPSQNPKVHQAHATSFRSCLKKQFLPLGWLKSKGRQQQVLTRNAENPQSSHTVGGNVKGTAVQKSLELSCDPAGPFLGMHPREMKTYVHAETYIQVFTASFIVVKKVATTPTSTSR